MTLTPKAIQKLLSKNIDADRVSIDEFERRLYSHDLAPLPKMAEFVFQVHPDIVVRPLNAKEVSHIVKTACKYQIPIVPRGAGSWGLGGSVPTIGGIVLDMTSMKKIMEPDAKNLSVVVQAGATWKELYDKVLEKDFIIGAYPSSAPAATVGGWINTGGIGIGSYRYSGAQEQIRSLEVVLPTGEILQTGFSNVLSNNTGLNLTSLFIGAEGTLGIITEATLKVHPGPEEIRPTTFGFKDLSSLAKALHDFTRMRIIPLNVTFVDKEHLHYLQMLEHDEPDAGALLNITFEGPKDYNDLREEKTKKVMEKYGGTQYSKTSAEHQWEERSYELRAKRLGPTVLMGEAYIPISEFEVVLGKVNRLAKKMKLKMGATGVLADRNTVTFMPYFFSDERTVYSHMMTLAFIKKLGDIAYKHGGHPAGLGLYFSSNLKKMHGRNGMRTMEDIKIALDPYNIMNPGKFSMTYTKYGAPIPPVAMNLGLNLLASLKRVTPKTKLHKGKKRPDLKIKKRYTKS